MTAAIDTVRSLYAEHKIGDFDLDLADYLKTGCVNSTPKDFVMAKPVALGDGRVAWFIQAAVGNLTRIVWMLPFRLPYIAFARRKDSSKRLRVYPVCRFLKSVQKCHVN
ncbi:MAG: hypothetical protein H0U23_17920 [Blastocatellia bacterium]|nr:hypothetical protein [Blastocatellia bacterium]